MGRRRGCRAEWRKCSSRSKSISLNLSRFLSDTKRLIVMHFSLVELQVQKEATTFKEHSVCTVPNRRGIKDKMSSWESLTPPEPSPLLLRPLCLLPVLISIGFPLGQLGLKRSLDRSRVRKGRSRLCGDDVAQLLRYVEDSRGGCDLRGHLHFFALHLLLHRERERVRTGGEDGVLQSHGLRMCVRAFVCVCVSV